MQAVNKSMGLAEWSLLILLSILWGGSFFFVGVAVAGLPPITIVTLRALLAAVVLYGVIRGTGLQMSRDRRVWVAFLGMGLLNNVIPHSLLVWGQTHIPSGLASILNATTPLFTVVVAHYLSQDEKATRGRVAGVLLGLVGVVVIMGPEALDQLGVRILAQLAVLGASLSYAFAGVFGRRFRRMGLTPMITAAGQVTASSAVMLPLALVVDQPWRLPMPGWGVWGAVLGLALSSTALAYVIYFRILASAGATNLLLYTASIRAQVHNQHRSVGGWSACRP